MTASSTTATEQVIAQIADTVVLVTDLDAKRRDAESFVEDLTKSIDVRALSDANLSRLAGLVWSPRVLHEVATRAGGNLGVVRVGNNPRVDPVNPTFRSDAVVKDPVACARVIVDFKQRFGSPEKDMTVWVGERTFYVRDSNVEAVTERLVALFA